MDFFEHFIKTPPLSASTVVRLVSQLRRPIPSGFSEMYCAHNGADGFARDSYVRIYPLDHLGDLNRSFQTARFAPGLTIFGSNGGGEALAFDPNGMIIQVTFIPLRAEYANVMGRSISELFGTLGGPSLTDAPRQDLLGLELHEVTPIVFGGDPVDPANKIALPLDKYAQLVVCWNNKYLEVAGLR
jgi:hypothetical protein